tara:strand:+ start:253 stop:387 length:135 start_codon:yes stop_codon:yes gene_type:complete
MNAMTHRTTIVTLTLVTACSVGEKTTDTDTASGTPPDFIGSYLC